MGSGVNTNLDDDRLVKQSTSNEDEGHYLPDSILDDIFIRLPAKSLFQFKCVWKRWLFLTSTPSFVRSYCQLSQARPWTFLYRYTCGQQFKHIPNKRKLHYVCSPDFTGPCFSVMVLPFRCEQFEIITASNGLLLCSEVSSRKYYVCNPITKQWVTLPSNGSRECYRSNDRNGFGIYRHNEGLLAMVEDGLSTRYKVVIPRLQFSHQNTLSVEFDIFCSEKGEWICERTACSLHCSILLEWLYLARPFVLNGTLHWPAYKAGFVLAYDPYRSQDTCFRLIKLPRPHSGGDCSRLCGASGGRLQYYEVSQLQGNHHLNLWELADEHGVEWSIKQACKWSNVWSNDEYLTWKLSNIRKSLDLSFTPVAFHPFDSDVMYLQNKEQIVSFNIRSRRLDLLCDPNGDFLGLCWWVMMPFVLPPWPTPLPRPSWGRYQFTSVTSS